MLINSDQRSLDRPARLDRHRGRLARATRLRRVVALRSVGRQLAGPLLRHSRHDVHGAGRAAGGAQEGAHLAASAARSVWMRMHIWLGLLAVPCIWFHSGFRLGGALTTRADGALLRRHRQRHLSARSLQQFLPAMMTQRVPLETDSRPDRPRRRGPGGRRLRAGGERHRARSPRRPRSRSALRGEEELVKRAPGYWKTVARQRPAETPAPGGGRSEGVLPRRRCGRTCDGHAARARRRISGRCCCARRKSGVRELEKLQAICEEVAPARGAADGCTGCCTTGSSSTRRCRFAMFVLVAVPRSSSRCATEPARG